MQLKVDNILNFQIMLWNWCIFEQCNSSLEYIANLKELIKIVT
jgi:hypothetical protein